MNTEHTNVKALLAVDPMDEATWPEWMTEKSPLDPKRWLLDHRLRDDAALRDQQLTMLVSSCLQSQNRYIAALRDALAAELPTDDRARHLWMRFCDAHDDLVLRAIEMTSKIERDMGADLPLVLRFEPLIERALALRG